MSRLPSFLSSFPLASPRPDMVLPGPEPAVTPFASLPGVVTHSDSLDTLTPLDSF